MHRSLLNGITCCLLITLTIAAEGATVTVTTTADSGPGSLREALR